MGEKEIDRENETRRKRCRNENNRRYIERARKGEREKVM